MIETERLILRLYKPNEKEKFNELFTDESVMKFVDTGVYTSEKAEEMWQKLVYDFYPKVLKTIYGVFTKEKFRYIGHASIRPRPTKKEDWEIGYILKTNAWGKGFATEIARGLIKFGFNKLNLPEVFATIDDDNFDSIKVAEKAGMSFLNYEFDEEGRFSVYSVKKLSYQSWKTSKVQSCL